MGILITISATLAAAVHVLIFYWESIGWKRPAVWKKFGVTNQADADTIAFLAFNQGFYNLFLAIGALLGGILFGFGLTAAGIALGLFSVASMLAAALVLAIAGRRHLRAAAVQGFFPLITVVLYIVSFWVGR